MPKMRIFIFSITKNYAIFDAGMVLSLNFFHSSGNTVQHRDYSVKLYTFKRVIKVTLPYPKKYGFMTML